MTENNVQFSSFPIGDIYPDENLPGDLYLFLGGHFVKYKNKSDFIDTAKYELFVLQRVQYVFVNSNELQDYKEWAKSLHQKEKEELVTEVGEENRDIAEQSLAMKNEFFAFVGGEINDKAVTEMLDKARDYVSAIKKKAAADRFLAKMLTYGQSIADHSTNVANLSVFLALNIGYGQQIILENIYNGALLHDYGKIKIDPRKLENPNSKEYKAAMAKHPELGKTALLMDSGFNDETLRIIVEHHERNDGTGFPKGLKGNRIYDLTKIVSIANYYDNLVVNFHKNAKNESIKGLQIKALRELEKDQGKLFDPKILAKCLRALERVIAV